MDIRSLSVVQAIPAEGSYQKAAQRLHCSQSTVTFQVRRLENELSLRLFERVGRRMVLSRAGKDILPHLEAVLSGMRNILQYGGEGVEPAGQARIGVAESLLSCLVPRMLGRFTQKAPRVRLELHCANCHDIRNGVLSGEYDMGLYYDVGHTSSLSLERLGRAEGVLVAAPSMPDSLRDFTSFHQEKDVAFIINEPRSVFRERMEAYLRVRDIRLSGTVEIWNIESIRRCVAEGMGVSFQPRFTVERDIAQGSLVEIAVPMAEKGADILCVHHRNREEGPALRCFRDLFAQVVNEASPGTPEHV